MFMNDLTNLQRIEALLFFKGEPMPLKRIMAILELGQDETLQALDAIREARKDTGIVLISHNDEFTLGTHPKAGPLIEEITKEELSRDLGKAGLETLSIVAYRGPLSRREIDYIRGVNSGFILRNLLVRGLVEKITSKEDERVTLYGPTTELLSYLGITSISELPEFALVKAEIETMKSGDAQKD
jgi:segregation and condensation protein B